MEWITSLLNTLCPFCGETLGSTQRACESCARHLNIQETLPVVDITLRDLPVRAALDYDGWIQGLILRQKRQPSRPVIRWLAGLLHARTPLPWRKLPLVWLPGKPLAEIHLVEVLALELARLGQPLARRQYLKRHLFRAARAQKSLSSTDRRTRDIAEIYRVPRQWGRCDRNVILLDDIVTTGATLLGCRELLGERLGIEVRGALALAFTKKRETGFTE